MIPQALSVIIAKFFRLSNPSISNDNNATSFLLIYRRIVAEGRPRRTTTPWPMNDKRCAAMGRRLDSGDGDRLTPRSRVSTLRNSIVNSAWKLPMRRGSMAFGVISVPFQSSFVPAPSIRHAKTVSQMLAYNKSFENRCIGLVSDTECNILRSLSSTKPILQIYL